jgi:two-component system, chemotaxis family, CheB/CheR fusion protein
MQPSEDTSPTDDVQRQLDQAHAQVLRYANDLTRLLEAERRKTQALAEAHARLQLLDQLKTDFLTCIAHELRTPLSHMHVVDLAEVVRQVAAQTPGLAEPGVAFAITAPSLPCRVHEEARHLATVVQILFDNAVKFSRQAPCSRVQIEVTGAEVMLTVADRGQGFPPAMARELFQPFTIADVRHHAEETGLNLALAQAIVAAYGGRLEADSAGVGKGATFVAAFPALSLTEDATGR